MYYGWAILAVCSVAAIASAPGQTFLLGMFNTPLREATGLGATALSGAYLVATLGSAFTLPWVGRLSDRIGPRWIVVLAALGLGFACQAIGWVRGVVSLTIVFYAFRLFGQGSLMLGSAHLLALWFDRRLGTAEGIRGTVQAAGFAALPPVVAWLFARHGWVGAASVLGFAVWAVVVPLTLLIARDSPAHVGTTLDGSEPGAVDADPGYTLGEAVRSGPFWAVLGLVVGSVLVTTAVLFHLQPLVTSLGLPVSVASRALVVNPLGSGVATLVGGWLADRVPLPRILRVGGLIAGAGVASLAAFGSAGGVFAALALLGVGQGLVTTAGATAIARWYGRAHHGSIRGFTSSSMVAGTSLGPLALSASRDLVHSWSPALVAFAAGLAALGLVCAFVGSPAPRAAAVAT